MAQRTAFLNSDAKWFNKDFHHTWINNYMIKQPWVMFSNYSTKPEFALGNWQISWGKAIIRCTRTTGTFAGEEILACFESTSTENISTAWNKKVYIEIPEVYVNDSTAITDSLTQWANLNVWRIVSSDSYPTHNNYIKLWEISNGDWQNATDLRPEVLRRGKPNTLSYFGGNGEEERIDIDNASLNKYLMSNWAWVAPSWEEGGGGWGWSWENFKRTFTTDEDLLAKSMFWVEVQPGTTDVNSTLDFGTTTATKVFFPVILNWEDFSSITLNLAAVNSPADTLSVRVETLDWNGLPTWTLVNVWAYWTATPSWTAADITVNMSWTVSWLEGHTKAAVVIERSGSASDSNYYQLWCSDLVKVISQIYEYNGSAYSSVDYSWCVDCDWFATEAIVQATSENWVDRIWYCETGANAGNDFTWILQWTFDYSWAEAWAKYYLSSTWTLITSWSKLVWRWLQDDVLQIWSSSGWWQNIYDAIVAADGSWDYTTLYAAVNAGKRNIYIKSWNYNETPISIADDSLYITWENAETVVLNYTLTTNTISQIWAVLTVSSPNKTTASSIINHVISWVKLNITTTGTTSDRYAWVLNAYTLSGTPNYKLLLENCNIIVAQTWAESYFIMWKLRDWVWEIIVNNSYIDVDNEDGFQTRFYSYSSREKTTISNSKLNIHTSSNYGVYFYDNYNIKYNSDIIVQTTWTWNVTCTLSNADNCNITVSASVNDWAKLTINNCNNCKIEWKKALSTANFQRTIVITVYKSWTSYSVWDQVVYLWTIYKCKTAHTWWEDFVFANWDATPWNVIKDLIWCNINIDWIVYVQWRLISNAINGWRIILTNTSDTSNNHTWALVQWNDMALSTDWVLIVAVCCSLTNNHISSNTWVTYNDNYHIIKDNIIVPYSSSWDPSVTKQWSGTTSKVSDNLILSWQS